MVDPWWLCQAINLLPFLTIRFLVLREDLILSPHVGEGPKVAHGLPDEELADIELLDHLPHALDPVGLDLRGHTHDEVIITDFIMYPTSLALPSLVSLKFLTL